MIVHFHVGMNKLKKLRRSEEMFSTSHLLPNFLPLKLIQIKFVSEVNHSTRNRLHAGTVKHAMGDGCSGKAGKLLDERLAAHFLIDSFPSGKDISISVQIKFVITMFPFKFSKWNNKLLRISE